MRILASNPDSLGDLVLRQPMYRKLLDEGHELVLLVRERLTSALATLTPEATCVSIPGDPYLLQLQEDASDYDGLLRSARESSPDLLLVAPYQWTRLEEELARELDGVPVMAMNGHVFRGAPEWGEPAASALRVDHLVKVAEDWPELRKNERMCGEILGHKVSLADPTLAPRAEQLQDARSCLERVGMSAGEYIVAFVGDTPHNAVRNWRPEHWAHVLAEWARKHGRKFLLLGTEDERATTEQIRQAMGAYAARAATVMGEGVTLDTVIGLLAEAHSYIGRDTGPMHLAAALGKPVIGVFGGGHWPRFLPAGKSSHIVTIKLPCFQCNWMCPFEEAHCIRQVPESEILRAIDRLEIDALGFDGTVQMLPPSDELRELMVQQLKDRFHKQTRTLGGLRREHARVNAALLEQKAAGDTVAQELSAINKQRRELERQLLESQGQLVQARARIEELSVELRKRLTTRIANYLRSLLRRPRKPPLQDAAPDLPERPQLLPATLAATLPTTLPDGTPWPRISVVTPSYNQGHYVEDTIRSVVDQGYPDLEYILIDGGSDDETMSVVDRYRDRIAHVVSEKDRGQAHAINKGFAKTSGEILTWLNSDDQLVPGALAAMAMAFHTSGADMVAGVCELYRDGEFQNAHLTSCVDGPLPLDDLLDLDGCWNTGKFFYQPEVMFTRELWERCGGRVDESWFYSMDYELWLRFAEHGARLHVIGRSIVHFRVHDEQKTSATEGFMTELPKVQKAFLERTGRAWMPRPLPKPGLSSLRIVFLNDLGCLGGASIAHQRLAKAVSLAGHQVFPVAISKYVDPTSPLATDDVVVNAVAQYQPDLVVVGNLHGAGMLAGVVGEITARWPTVFVMHDLWIVSGRCAYPGDCTKYRTGCDDACPTPYEYPPLAPHRIRGAWELRRKILTTERAPVLACNSEWTAQAARSAVASASSDRPTVVPIHLAFPLDTFRPLDKSECREVLDLPQDRFIVLFSASSLDEVRKGAAHLAEAIATLDLDDVLPVCLGHGSAAGSAVKNMRCMGYISDENELAMLYSAADVFVGPSLEEAFGQVFIEAAACGTPSVGFPVGGIPEAVNHGVSGLVAEAASSQALAKAIRRLHDDPGLCQDLGRWARIWVENEWSEKSSYRTLFNALDAAGLRQRLGLAPKIGFAAVPPSVGEIARLDSRYPPWLGLAARTGRMGWWAVRHSWWILQRMTTRQGRVRLHGLASRVLRPFRHRGRKQRAS